MAPSRSDPYGKALRMRRERLAGPGNRAPAHAGTHSEPRLAGSVAMGALQREPASGANTIRTDTQLQWAADVKMAEHYWCQWRSDIRVLAREVEGVDYWAFT